MKIPEPSNAPAHAGEDAPPEAAADNASVKERLSFAATVANSFTKFDVALRARLLGRLLGSVGPLALLVVGGFAIIQANSKEEALQHVKHFIQIAGDGECELRQLFEADRYAPGV